ncbi:MAG: hypothetical protein HY809_02195 [Nitrospirae bacterium]|nr:hypothetical protein [Nitrospirota bacterium]
MTNMPSHKTDKLYLPVSIILLLLSAIYLSCKFFKRYEPDFIYGLDFLALTVFSISTGLLILLFYKFDKNRKRLFILIFVILFTVTAFSYYFTLPEKCIDCAGDITVGALARKTGMMNFIKDYNKPALYQIKHDSNRYRRFLKYDDLLKLHYKEDIDKIPDDASGDERFSNMAVFRTSKHSPFWFCIIGFWQALFGEAYLSHVILGFLTAVLYLFSLYIFLGLFYGNDNFKDKLSIIFLYLLLPAFLIQATRPKNDLLVGIFITWTLYFLFKNKKEGINMYDITAGACLSFAVISKFTSLTIFLPVIMFYLMTFRYKAIPKLTVLLSTFLVIPLSLYYLFEYDMLLNIISGSVEQTIYNYQNVFIEMFVRRFLFEQYYLGIPFLVLTFIFLIKYRTAFFHSEISIPYLFVSFFYGYFFILWGSEVARHLTGYLPLSVPMTAVIYNHCKEKEKLILTAGILLLINNYLILLDRYIDLNTLYKIRWSFW